MERNLGRTIPRRDSGFSLLEILVVVAMIMILLAVALPNIAGYIRNQRIMGARQQVASALQEARTRAISRNVATGVSLAIVGRDRYRIILDDPLVVGGALADQLGEVRQLPQGVEFTPNPRGALDTGVRFTRLGALEAFEFATPCTAAEAALAQFCDPAPVNSAADAVGFGIDPGGDAIVRLRETATNLWQDVVIAPGGRILQTQTDL